MTDRYCTTNLGDGALEGRGLIMSKTWAGRRWRSKEREERACLEEGRLSESEKGEGERMGN